MFNLKDTLATITGWFGDVVKLGLSLALVFLVVDILFGVGTTDIVVNVVALVDEFTGQGIAGLIAFIIFMSIYRSE